MAKINLHRRFDFNIARGSYFGWVKFLFSSKHGTNYPYKLIYNSNNRLFVTTKALSLLFKVGPKYRIVNYGHHSHLKEDISKMRVPLLRDTHPLSPSSKLFNNRIIPSIAYKVPARKKAFLMEDVKPFINSTDIKEILRDINTNGNNLRNLHMFFESLISILPLGRGFMAQPTYWDLMDRGTYSSRGLIAYKPWSLCPSLFYMGFNNTFIAGGKDGEKWVKY